MAAAVVVGCSLLLSGGAAHADDDDGTASAAGAVNQGRAYPGNPDSEAALVAAEDARLVEVRTIGSLAASSGHPVNSPYRLATGSAYTLVLTARSEPYSVTDLLQLEPQTFVRQPDGSYLLSENIVVQSGATLNLAAPGGLKLLLASDADGFVSVVSYGGRLNIAGTDGAPAVISSYDRQTKTADTDTSDGRAYIRAIGGQVNIADADLESLGFWSGRTGGLSLTGTDRPTAGALNTISGSVDLGALQEPTESGNPHSPLGQVLPTGPLPVPTVDGTQPQYSFVAASIVDTTVTGNAFGIFASGSNGLDIRNSSFSSSLVSGVVLHRYVVNAVIQNTSADRNYQDGFVLSRATTGIVLSQDEAVHNYRNGVTMSGLPLATGPSSTGTSVGSYGNNSLANSRLSDNGRYGVEVIGGHQVSVLANQVAHNEMGIVVRDIASGIDVSGNRVEGSSVQGITVRDGVESADISGNVVDGGQTSVYVRDAAATVKNNTLTDASNHGLSMVGQVRGSAVEDNKIAGRGPSAIDIQRADGITVRSWQNDASDWDDTTPFLRTLTKFLQPLTLMWLILAALLLFTAVRGARSRHLKRHPYDDKRPVTDGVAATERGRVPEGVGA